MPSNLTNEQVLAFFQQWQEENSIWRIVVRTSPFSLNVEGTCIGVNEKSIGFEVRFQEEPLYIDWSKFKFYWANPKMVRNLFGDDRERTYSACMMADLPWPEAVCFMKVETVEKEVDPIDERAEFMRQVALVLLDTTAHGMAVRRLLYDAGLADEKRYQQTYTSILKEQLEVFRDALQTSDGARVIQIIEALSKSPHKT